MITLPIGLFAATFLFDIVFWVSGNAAFATTATWLLWVRLAGRCCGRGCRLIDFLGDGRIRNISDAWHHAIGNVILVLVQAFSFYWRYRYGAAGVLPVGIGLSLLAVLIMGYTGWKGGELVFRHRVAVYDAPQPSADAAPRRQDRAA